MKNIENETTAIAALKATYEETAKEFDAAQLAFNETLTRNVRFSTAGDRTAPVVQKATSRAEQILADKEIAARKAKAALAYAASEIAYRDALLTHEVKSKNPAAQRLATLRDRLAKNAQIVIEIEQRLEEAKRGHEEIALEAIQDHATLTLERAALGAPLPLAPPNWLGTATLLVERNLLSGPLEISRLIESTIPGSATVWPHDISRADQLEAMLAGRAHEPERLRRLRHAVNVATHEAASEREDFERAQRERAQADARRVVKSPNELAVESAAIAAREFDARNARAAAEEKAAWVAKHTG